MAFRDRSGAVKFFDAGDVVVLKDGGEWAVVTKYLNTEAVEAGEEPRYRVVMWRSRERVEIGHFDALLLEEAN